MNDQNIKADWLTNNAVVAFIGALLLGQYTQTSAGDYKWLFGIEIPGMLPIANLVGAVILFALAIALALSRAIPPLRRRALALTVPFVPVLEVLVWAAFTLGLISAVSRLPVGHLFSGALMIGGLVFSVFLLGRFLWTCSTWSTNEVNEVPD